MPTVAPQPVGRTVYKRLDLTGVRLPASVITGNEGRAAMLRTARDLGYPTRTITPALTRFSRIYVIQLSGDLDTGQVALATGNHQAVVVKLPIDVRYRIVAPTKVEAMLAAVLADYPSTSVTAALAEALAGVLHVCERQRTLLYSTVGVQDITEALAPPLNAFLQPWTTDTSAAADDPSK
jgi:hypothetical protein